jgi:hypothetical protein
MGTEGADEPDTAGVPYGAEAVAVVTLLEAPPEAGPGAGAAPDDRRPRQWDGAAYLCVVPVVAVALRQWPLVGDATAPSADWAVIELNVRSALEGRQLLGPYSRFGFNHPGPAMFYLLALPYALLGRSFGALLIATALLNATLCVLIVWVARRLWGTTGVWASSATLAVFLWRFGPERLRDPWNPYLVILPIALVLLLVADISRQPGRGRLVLFAALATLAIQSHLGSAVVVGAATAFLVVGLIGYGRRRGARTLAGLCWPAALATVVLWAPPLVEQLRGWPGNLVRIGNFIVKPSSDVHTVADATKPMLLSLAMGTRDLGWRFGPASAFVEAPIIGPATLAGIAVLTALSTFAAVHAARHHRRHELLALGAIAAAVVAFLLSAVRMRGELFLYLFMPMIGVAVAAWVAAVSMVVGLLGERADPGRRPGAAGVSRGFALAAVLAVLAGSFTIAASRHAADDGSLDAFSSPDGRQLVAALGPVCSGSATDVTVSAGPDAPWDQAVAVGLGLARCGRRVGFTDGLAAIAGAEYGPRPGGAHLVVGAASAPGAPGQIELARTATSSLFETP